MLCILYFVSTKQRPKYKAPSTNSHVSEVKRHFLHHLVPGNRHLPDRAALVAAGHVGDQRLGQQLFSVICCAKDWHSGIANRCCVRLGARRREWRRDSESRNRFLGNLSFQKHSPSFASAD